MKFLAVALLFLSVSCTPSAEELVNSLIDYEGGSYECYHGNATLPPGVYPDYLVGSWKCEEGTAYDLHLHSDGTMWFTLQSESYANLLEYWHDCGGHPGSPTLGQTGRWIIDEAGRLCVQRNNIQPGIYFCLEFTYESGVLTGSNYADYYDSDGDYLGGEHSDSGADICTLEQE